MSKVMRARISTPMAATIVPASMPSATMSRRADRSVTCKRRVEGHNDGHGHEEEFERLHGQRVAHLAEEPAHRQRHVQDGHRGNHEVETSPPRDGHASNE